MLVSEIHFAVLFALLDFRRGSSDGCFHGLKGVFDTIQPLAVPELTVFPEHVNQDDIGIVFTLRKPGFKSRFPELLNPEAIVT